MNREKNIKKEITEWIVDLAIAVILAGAVLFFFKPIIIQQNSMEPSFHSGDYVVTSRQAYRLFGEPERGDVIVFVSELLDDKGNKKSLIKRIIGLPGDKVAIKDGYVYVNDEMIEEEYLATPGISGEMEELTVPEDSLFCCGDNRGVSLDSRSGDVGFIPYDKVVGKVFVRLFPFNKIEKF